MSWQPGNPLYERPRLTFTGGVVRPMFEVLDDDFGSPEPTAATDMALRFSGDAAQAARKLHVSSRLSFIRHGHEEDPLVLTYDQDDCDGMTTEQLALMDVLQWLSDSRSALWATPDTLRALDEPDRRAVVKAVAIALGVEP